MADGNAALDVHLHPLVLINISDQVVRFRSSGRPEGVACGALIGAQEGRRVDIHNSFDLVVESDASRAPDFEFFKERLGQYLEVFPKYEFLGWYTTGAEPQDSDKVVHKKFQEVTENDNPFLLLLDTAKLSGEMASQSEELPVKIFDAKLQLSGTETQLQWNEVCYQIDTLDAERISVNHVKKSGTQSSGQSSDFTQHTSGLGNSVLMLNNRVKVLLEHAIDIKAGRAPKNHEVLRQLLSICEALKSTHPEALQRQFYGEFNDASLVVLLASLTKACSHTSDLLDRFSLAHDKRHRQRHHYPFG